MLSCALIISIMKFRYHCFFKIYVRNNWLEIWYCCSKLVAFATIETKSDKRQNKLIIHNQECKIKIKIIEGYLHSQVGMNMPIYQSLYYAIFKFLNIYSMIKLIHYSNRLFILFIKSNINDYKFLQWNYWNIYFLINQ